MISPMLSRPKSGSKWAAPNSTAWSTIANTAAIFDSRPRSTAPRNSASSTIGAKITARQRAGGDRRVVALERAAVVDVEIAPVGNVEEAHQADGDAHRRDRADPDQRSPPEVDPPEPHPEVAEHAPGPPPPAGVPHPQHRRPVADDDGDRHVDDDVPIAVDRARRATPGWRSATRRGSRSPRWRSGSAARDAAARPAGGSRCDVVREGDVRRPAVAVEVARHRRCRTGPDTSPAGALLGGPNVPTGWEIIGVA